MCISLPVCRKHAVVVALHTTAGIPTAACSVQWQASLTIGNIWCLLYSAVEIVLLVNAAPGQGTDAIGSLDALLCVHCFEAAVTKAQACWFDSIPLWFLRLTQQQDFPQLSVASIWHVSPKTESF